MSETPSNSSRILRSLALTFAALPTPIRSMIFSPADSASRLRVRELIKYPALSETDRPVDVGRHQQVVNGLDDAIVERAGGIAQEPVFLLEQRIEEDVGSHEGLRINELGELGVDRVAPRIPQVRFQLSRCSAWQEKTRSVA